ncbi:MAG: FHA domain-containing protein [Magnetococcus sp. DMHC-6]
MEKIILSFKGNVRGEFLLNKNLLTIGRSFTNDIPIDNLGVSREHARIYKKTDGLWIEDLNSNNGTYVNDIRLKGHTPQLIKIGDILLIGKHHLEIQSSKEGDELGKTGQKEEVASQPKNISALEGTVFMSTPNPQPNTVLNLPNQQKSSQNLNRTGTFSHASLVLLKNSKSLASGRDHFDLGEESLTIGKSPNVDIRLSGFFIGSFAILIVKEKDGYHVTPMGGWIKPRLNGQKLTQTKKLNHGDILELRGYRFQYNI